MRSKVSRWRVEAGEDDREGGKRKEAVTFGFQIGFVPRAKSLSVMSGF